jgi:hypothetical protein
MLPHVSSEGGPISIGDYGELLAWNGGEYAFSKTKTRSRLYDAEV